ncbi:alpha/beta hydrolase, partial [Candidatus Gracilibacteria bacterium]|nr:alpha/beta hydrolase [Candidatus Gracilibacteria bacterium]
GVFHRLGRALGALVGPWLYLAGFEVNALAALAINGLAAVHARAATHFVADAPPLAALLHAPLPTQLGALFTGVPLPRPQNHSTPADHHLPYATYAIMLANGEHLEAWHVPHPQPRGLVLLFVGYGGVKEGALTPAAKLFEFGFSSLLVDFRGAGGSARSDQTLGIREAEDVIAAWHYAAAQWPGLPLYLYGVSMGGAAILRAVALAGLPAQGLILEAVFDRLTTTTRHRFAAYGLPGTPAAELLLFWGGVQLGVDPFSHNPVEHAAHVSMPVLLLYGERDPWILPPERVALAGALRGPVEVVVFPEQGHGGPTSTPIPHVGTPPCVPFSIGDTGDTTLLPCQAGAAAYKAVYRA